MALLVINGDTVRELFPMSAAVPLMRQTMCALAEGQAYQPPRTVSEPPGLGGFLFIKPAALLHEPAFGLKAITLFPHNAQHGLDAIQGFVALLDPSTGVPTAILDGGVLTEIRTGAVSAVATDLLAHPTAGNLALIGAGAQARAHLMALAEVRQLHRVRVWSRSAEGARALCAWAASQGHAAEPVGSVEEAVKGADLICTVTTSPDPLLDGDWVAPGCHINAVGAFQATTRELHTNVVTSARIVVDSRESAATAAGDLLIPISEGALPADADHPELGELLAGSRSDGRASTDDITIFESLGLAVQDIAAGAYVAAQARDRSLGTSVPF